MSGSLSPGSPPPEVPDEFVEAYRAAYEQALAAQSVPLKQGHHAEPEVDETGLPRRTRRIAVGTHRTAPPIEEAIEDGYDETPTAFERARDSGWLVPVLLAVLALVLIGGAYVLGRSFTDRVAGNNAEPSESRIVMSEGDSSDRKQPVSQQRAGEDAWEGKVEAVEDVRARAGCRSEPGEDASGETVTYGARNLVDGVADTTWRCDGSAVGERITFTFGEEVDVAEVGLIPGYAKTDEADGTDRYAENNRVTRVRWSIGETVVEQRLSGDPQDRSLRLVRVPRTKADSVTLEILAVDKGDRDTTAISEVQFSAA